MRLLADVSGFPVLASEGAIATITAMRSTQVFGFVKTALLSARMLRLRGQANLARGKKVAGVAIGGLTKTCPRFG